MGAEEELDVRLQLNFLEEIRNPLPLGEGVIL
jgi:hypothetical protein